MSYPICDFMFSPALTPGSSDGALEVLTCHFCPVIVTELFVLLLMLIFKALQVFGLLGQQEEAVGT